MIFKKLGRLLEEFSPSRLCFSGKRSLHIDAIHVIFFMWHGAVVPDMFTLNLQLGSSVPLRSTWLVAILHQGGEVCGAG